MSVIYGKGIHSKIEYPAGDLSSIKQSKRKLLCLNPLRKRTTQKISRHIASIRDVICEELCENDIAISVTIEPLIQNDKVVIQAIIKHKTPFKERPHVTK